MHSPVIVSGYADGLQFCGAQGMSNAWRLFPLFLLVLCAPAVSADHLMVPIPGGGELRIGVDDDYVRMSERTPELFALMARLSNQQGWEIFEFLITERDLEAITNDDDSDNGTGRSVYKIGIHDDYRAKKVSAEEWRRLRTTIRAGVAGIDMEKMKGLMQDHFNEALEREIETALGSDAEGVAKITLAEIDQLRLYGNDPESVRFFVRTRASFEMYEEQDSGVMLNFGAFMRASGKLILLGSENTAPEDEAGLQKLREEFDRVVDSLLYLNTTDRPALGAAPTVPAPAV